MIFFQLFGCFRQSSHFGVVGHLSLWTDQTQRHSEGHQALVSIVLTQPKSELCTTGKHSVRLCGAQVNQIIDHNTDIGFVPTRFPGLFALGSTGGIDSRQEALCTSFLISGGAIDLSCEKQPLHRGSF